MDRLLEVKEREVRIDFEKGCKCAATIHVKNAMNSLPVAFKVQTNSPDKFYVRPPNGLIAPMGECTFDIILKPQSELPNEFPFSNEKFIVKSALSPMSTTGTFSERVPSDWFDSNKRKVFVDAQIKVVYTGGLLLRHFVTEGNLTSASQILRRQNSMDGIDENGRTVMHIAAANGNLEMVEMLLDAGARVDPINKAGYTPLLEAIYMKHTEVTKALLNRGADIEFKSPGGWTALHLASSWDQLQTVHLLVEKGANPDAKDHDSRTALHCAAREGYVTIVRALLEAGADKDACSRDGRSVIFRATEKGSVVMVDLLLEWGANPRIRDVSGKSAFDAAIQKGNMSVLNVLQREEDLLTASRKGDLKTVVESLKKGAHVNRSDQFGWTPLHCAAFKGHKDVVATLLDSGADSRCADSEGNTPLHCAVEGGHKKIVELLVGRTGTDIHAKNSRGGTPVYIATAMRYESISKLLTSQAAAESEGQARDNSLPFAAPLRSYSLSKPRLASPNGKRSEACTETLSAVLPQKQTVITELHKYPLSISRSFSRSLSRSFSPQWQQQVVVTDFAPSSLDSVISTSGSLSMQESHSPPPRPPSFSAQKGYIKKTVRRALTLGSLHLQEARWPLSSSPPPSSAPKEHIQGTVPSVPKVATSDQQPNPHPEKQIFRLSRTATESESMGSSTKHHLHRRYHYHQKRVQAELQELYANGRALKEFLEEDVT